MMPQVNCENIRAKKTNPKREEFNNFIESVKRSASFNGGLNAFSEIKESLRSKSQTIYDTDSLSQVFETLLTSDNLADKSAWTEIENNFLVSIVAYYCLYSSEDFRSLSDKDWQCIEAMFPTKQICQIIRQWNSLLKVNVKQCPWTPEEDQELMKLVAECGSERNWRMIAEKLNAVHGMRAVREMRQCRDRWMKHLNLKLQKGGWSKEEDLKLLKAFVSQGRKWAEIAKILGDRTDSAVKNRINSLIKENKSITTLDGNLSSSGEDSDKRIARRIIEKLSAERPKKEKQIKKESVKKAPVPETQNADKLEILNLFSGNQTFSFRVVNDIPTQRSDEMKAAFGSNMFFAFVDMKSQRINLLNRV